GLDPREHDCLQGLQLGGVAEDDGAQTAAVDRAVGAENAVAPAPAHLGLDVRLPQGLVAQLVAGDQNPYVAGEFGGHGHFGAADAADQADDRLTVFGHTTRSPPGRSVV